MLQRIFGGSASHCPSKPLSLSLGQRERISKLRLVFLARRETARKRSIHAVCMQVRRAGALRFCREPAHNAARGT